MGRHFPAPVGWNALVNDCCALNAQIDPLYVYAPPMGKEKRGKQPGAEPVARVPTFYTYCFGTQGPHTVSHSFIYRYLSTHSWQDVFHEQIEPYPPEAIDGMIARENAAAFLSPAMLNVYRVHYKQLFLQLQYWCARGLLQHIDNQDDGFTDDRLLETVNHVFLQIMEMHPYGSYAWYRPGGATALFEMGGKGESEIDIYDYAHDLMNHPERILDPFAKFADMDAYAAFLTRRLPVASDFSGLSAAEQHRLAPFCPFTAKSLLDRRLRFIEAHMKVLLPELHTYFTELYPRGQLFFKFLWKLEFLAAARAILWSLYAARFELRHLVVRSKIAAILDELQIITGYYQEVVPKFYQKLNQRPEAFILFDMLRLPANLPDPEAKPPEPEGKLIAEFLALEEEALCRFMPPLPEDPPDCGWAPGPETDPAFTALHTARFAAHLSCLISPEAAASAHQRMLEAPFETPQAVFDAIAAAGWGELNELDAVPETPLPQTPALYVAAIGPFYLSVLYSLHAPSPEPFPEDPAIHMRAAVQRPRRQDFETAFRLALQQNGFGLVDRDARGLRALRKSCALGPFDQAQPSLRYVCGLRTLYDADHTVVLLADGAAPAVYPGTNLLPPLFIRNTADGSFLVVNALSDDEAGGVEMPENPMEQPSPYEQLFAALGLPCFGPAQAEMLAPLRREGKIPVPWRYLRPTACMVDALRRVMETPFAVQIRFFDGRVLLCDTFAAPNPNPDAPPPLICIADDGNTFAQEDLPEGGPPEPTAMRPFADALYAAVLAASPEDRPEAFCPDAVQAVLQKHLLLPDQDAVPPEFWLSQADDTPAFCAMLHEALCELEIGNSLFVVSQAQEILMHAFESPFLPILCICSRPDGYFPCPSADALPKPPSLPPYDLLLYASRFLRCGDGPSLTESCLVIDRKLQTGLGRQLPLLLERVFFYRQWLTTKLTAGAPAELPHLLTSRYLSEECIAALFLLQALLPANLGAAMQNCKAQVTGAVTLLQSIQAGDPSLYKQDVDAQTGAWLDACCPPDLYQRWSLEIDQLHLFAPIMSLPDPSETALFAAVASSNLMQLFRGLFEPLSPMESCSMPATPNGRIQTLQSMAGARTHCFFPECPTPVILCPPTTIDSSQLAILAYWEWWLNSLPYEAAEFPEIPPHALNCAAHYTLIKRFLEMAAPISTSASCISFACQPYQPDCAFQAFPCGGACPPPPPGTQIYVSFDGKHMVGCCILSAVPSDVPLDSPFATYQQMRLQDLPPRCIVVNWSSQFLFIQACPPPRSGN